MKRWQLMELEDLSWWPHLFRDAATDYLVTALHATKSYSGLAPLLAEAIEKTGASQITDLCSGGGGPHYGLIIALELAAWHAGVWHRRNGRHASREPDTALWGITSR